MIYNFLGDVLVTLLASDPDGDPIRLTIDIDDYFDIREVNGNPNQVEVYSTRGIDYEQNNNVRFTVTATDLNSNSRVSSKLWYHTASKLIVGFCLNDTNRGQCIGLWQCIRFNNMRDTYFRQLLDAVWNSYSTAMLWMYYTYLHDERYSPLFIATELSWWAIMPSLNKHWINHHHYDNPCTYFMYDA